MIALPAASATVPRLALDHALVADAGAEQGDIAAVGVDRALVDDRAAAAPVKA